jgi:hypothetical protein
MRSSSSTSSDEQHDEVDSDQRSKRKTIERSNIVQSNSSSRAHTWAEPRRVRAPWGVPPPSLIPMPPRYCYVSPTAKNLDQKQTVNNSGDRPLIGVERAGVFESQAARGL